MRNTRHTAGLIARVMATGVLMTGLAAVMTSPNVYHDISFTSRLSVPASSATTPSTRINVYHDI